MRVIFMGTPDFAVSSLAALSRTHDVVGVFTRPDAVSGRGSMTRPSPVKTAANNLGLPVTQPASLRDAGVQAQIAEAHPDIIVVAAYGLILPREVLELPPLGSINVHASLLPRWRGAAPIQRAILAGDATTGVSIMRMEEGLDTGPYCRIERVDIADQTAAELTERLAVVGAHALLAALDSLAAGTCEWVAQDDAQATYADKVGKADVRLEPGLATEVALRRIRAAGPQAPARAYIAGKGVTIERARPARTVIAPGSVVTAQDGIVLGFSDGAIEVVELKPDGKSGMAAADWARGLRTADDIRWSGQS